MPLGDVDPIWMDRTYFLVPGAAPAQRRPYKLLLEAMEEAGVGAIGRFVRSGRESLCLVRARGRGLVLETLYLVEDVYFRCCSAWDSPLMMTRAEQAGREFMNRGLAGACWPSPCSVRRTFVLLWRGHPVQLCDRRVDAHDRAGNGKTIPLLIGIAIAVGLAFI